MRHAGRCWWMSLTKLASSVMLTTCAQQSVFKLRSVGSEMLGTVGKTVFAKRKNLNCTSNFCASEHPTTNI